MKSVFKACQKALMLLATLTVLLTSAADANAKSSPSAGVDGREPINLNMGWDFHLGDGDPASFTDWKSVDLPHDYQISQPWVEPQEGDAGDYGDQASNISSRLSSRGFKEMGAGWYRKTITPPME